MVANSSQNFDPAGLARCAAWRRSYRDRARGRARWQNQQIRSPPKTGRPPGRNRCSTNRLRCTSGDRCWSLRWQSQRWSILIGGIAWWLYARQFESTDDAFIDGHAVQMAPKIAGYVTRLNIVDNQLVHQGDVLLEIDPRDYQVALDAAKASEAAALQPVGAGHRADRSGRRPSKRGRGRRAGRRSDRSQRRAGSGPQQQPGAARSGQPANARCRRSPPPARRPPKSRPRVPGPAPPSRRPSWLARKKPPPKPTSNQSQVEIRRAELNLSYTKIIAPITGRVTHRTVELGDYLQPGQALFALVDPNVWVTANFKETQLTHMHVGQPVEVRVDAFPGRLLPAHVDSFQRGTGARFTLLPAENATGNYVKVVQRVPVKIVFDQPAAGRHDFGARHVGRADRHRPLIDGGCQAGEKTRP